MWVVLLVSLCVCVCGCHSDQEATPTVSEQLEDSQPLTSFASGRVSVPVSAPLHRAGCLVTIAIGVSVW